MAEDRMMEGKVAVVTGAGRGIGREMALMLAQEGASVVVNDLGSTVNGEGVDESVAQSVVNEIKALGGKAVASTDSVAEPDSAKHIIDLAVASFGRIDAVINNAGILRDRIFHKMTPEEFDSVIKVHLYGAFYVSLAAAQHFRQQNF